MSSQTVQRISLLLRLSRRVLQLLWSKGLLLHKHIQTFALQVLSAQAIKS